MTLLLLITLAIGDQLQDEISSKLQKSEIPNYSEVELILIAEGVASPDELKTYVGKYEAFLGELALTPKQAKGNDKKKARALHKTLFGKLPGSPAEKASLRGMLDGEGWNPLLATLVYAVITEKAGVTPKDWVTDKLDVNFNRGANIKDIAAAQLTTYANQLDDTQSERTALAMKISSFLAPNSLFGLGSIEQMIYNRALAAFNENRLTTAAHLIIAGATRFPEQAAFPPIAYNTGIKLFQASEPDDEAVNGLARELMVHMGEHGKGFAPAFDTRQYNLAARIYNEKDYARAIVELEKVKTPPDEANYRNVLASAYSLLAEQRLDEGKTEEGQKLLTKLKEMDPERYDLLNQRLQQLKLKEMVESGSLETALKDAEARLGSEIDRNNYSSIVVRYNQALRNSKDFEKALSIIDQVPEAAQMAETANNLRFNTYSDWVDSIPIENYKTLIPLYKRVLADKKLTMTPENHEIFIENYGTALYLEVKNLIENNKFKEADKKSKAALKVAPKHKNLLQQRKLVDTILERIGGN